MSGQLCLKWNNHANAFNKLLNQIFLEDGNGYSDVTILCHGKFYPVHRFVLSTCSEYFEEMFQQCIRLNNKHPFIIVKDIHPEQMEALLNYMYKGEVNVPQEHLPELIKAAEAFKIKGLAVPDEDELSAKKKRNASSRSLSPEPKRSKNNEHLESTETENNSESSETSNFIAESFCEPLISEIKCEPLVTISEDFPVIENTNSEVMPDITKEEEIYSSSKSFDFGTSVQYQQQQESESQWNEDFQSFEEGEGSQEDSNNRSVVRSSFLRVNFNTQMDASMATPGEEVISRRGKTKFKHNDFLYVFEKASKREKDLLFWRCDQMGKCNVRLHTKHGFVVKEINAHSHNPCATSADAVNVC